FALRPGLSYGARQAAHALGTGALLKLGLADAAWFHSVVTTQHTTHTSAIICTAAISSSIMPCHSA
ncbi:hypothetical protein LAJ55_13400, partial [Streptococcus pneumoniae]|uniref:hypothetical protein n=1 Tax=Streptococcus pneumoniae TaxID=1313 RepID=UPI001CC0449B